MRIVYNNFIPFKGFSAMAFFGYIFARKEYAPLSDKTINHESIHAEQAKECGGWVLFYLKYLWFWIKYFGYSDIPFEKEAYQNDDDMTYLDHRDKKAWREFV
jgi:hypothetical protein